MQADPILGAAAESLILQWEEDREHIRQIYVCAWEQSHGQFDTIGEASKLVQEAHRTIAKGKPVCQDYLALWDRLARESLKLLEKRGLASGKPSGWPQSKQGT